MNTGLIHEMILRSLEAIAPHPMPEATLLHGINRCVRPPLDEAQIKERLSFLADRALVRVMLDELDPDSRKWVITETGKATIASLPTA